jgi:hypothetical protein
MYLASKSTLAYNNLGCQRDQDALLVGWSCLTIEPLGGGALECGALALSDSDGYVGAACNI